MAKIPEHPEEIFDDFTADYYNIYGEDLVSITLYGSGARGDYVKGVSDLNFLIILVETSIGQLTKAIPLIEKWRKRYVATPLFLTEGYIASALDAFPIEFLDMQAAHRVVYGEDPLAGLSFDDQNLRLQCERELRGKLLHLRQTYLSAVGREQEIRRLIRQSLTAFAPLFRGLLTLQRIPAPKGRHDILLRTAETFGLDQKVFLTLSAWGAGEKKLKREEERISLFERYVEEVDRLVTTIDRWKQI